MPYSYRYQDINRRYAYSTLYPYKLLQSVQIEINLLIFFYHIIFFFFFFAFLPTVLISGLSFIMLTFHDNRIFHHHILYSSARSPRINLEELPGLAHISWAAIKCLPAPAWQRWAFIFGLSLGKCPLGLEGKANLPSSLADRLQFLEGLLTHRRGLLNFSSRKLAKALFCQFYIKSTWSSLLARRQFLELHPDWRSL